MSIASVLYATGALMQGWVALMLAFVWHALRPSAARWALWLAAAFALNTVRTALLATGVGDVALRARASPVTSGLAVAAIWMMTVALVDYVGLRGRTARLIETAAAVALACVAALTFTGWLSRGGAILCVVPFFGIWVALFVHALRREPHGGHGAVIAALLTFPLFAIAANTGAIPGSLQPAAELFPLVGIGLTVLTAGLIRAHRQAQHETQATAEALAAREQAQAALRTANETLEQRVAARTRELRETIEGLESFNRSVSHDLRGPLGGIAGVAQLAREHVNSGNPAQAERMLDAIARQAEQSVRLVAALLALARAGDAQLQRTRVDSAALVKEVVGAVHQHGCAPDRADAPDIVVGQLPIVDADPELLRQAFANLIGNACKFASATDRPRIEIGHAATDRGPAFYVRDNGIGFAAADAERLFKPFERLHGKRFDGFGVGLSIVRRIVDHHGGQIWAEGVPGRGATFWFTVPPA